MDLAAEKKKLLERDAEWAASASEGSDVERILSFWTDDALVVQPGLPPVKGKNALREYVQTSLKIPGFKINWSSNDATFSTDGNLAYMFSSQTVTMHDPDGKSQTTEGRAITIWRKESDGEWRCVVDIWNDGPAE